MLDSPAGLHGTRLDALMKLADHIVVPLQPSPFDIAATHAFLQTLRSHRRTHPVRLGLVAMRVKEHTHAVGHLHEFLAALGQPPVAELRETQNYVHLAARGLTLWDVAPGRVERDLKQWHPLTQWMDT